jgi:hypothetical protein
MQKDYRKYSDNLIVSGTAVMFFGIWSMIKEIMMLLLGQSRYFDYIPAKDDPAYFETAASAYVVFALMVILTVLARIYVGMNARWIGAGKRCHKRFLALSIFMLILNVGSVIEMLISGGYSTYYSGLDAVATALLDITAVYCMADMLWAVHKINEIRRYKGRA